MGASWCLVRIKEGFSEDVMLEERLGVLQVVRQEGAAHKKRPGCAKVPPSQIGWKFRYGVGVECVALFRL